MSLSKVQEKYTYSDFLNWEGEEQWELIEGTPYAMATPTRRHQEISMRLSRWMGNFLEGKSCRIYAAPFAVRLEAEKDDDTVVQPDIAVICDLEKLDDKGCNGAPDIIMEILSPSTARVDQIIKLNKYIEAGVPEYWIIDPLTNSVLVYISQEGKSVVKGYTEDKTVKLHRLPGLEINLEELFKD